MSVAFIYLGSCEVKES
uniref:Uncharacterized protein n=1 Tax=Rhizophora mucronata TaxID=61149 RepID=A0A2P2PYY1_RHIMU